MLIEMAVSMVKEHISSTEVLTGVRYVRIAVLVVYAHPLCFQLWTCGRQSNVPAVQWVTYIEPIFYSQEWFIPNQFQHTVSHALHVIL